MLARRHGLRPAGRRPPARALSDRPGARPRAVPLVACGFQSGRCTAPDRPQTL